LAIVWVLVGTVGDAQSDKKSPTPEQILASYGVGTTTVALTDALASPRAMVRENAAILLGQRKERSAAQQLHALLSDAYVYARLAAADALLQIGDASALSTVRALLQEKDAYAAVRAALVLVNNGSDEGLRGAVDIAGASVRPSERVLAVRALPMFNRFESDRPIVLKELLNRFENDTDVTVRRAAASELMDVQTPEVAEAFRRAANDPDPVIGGLAEAYSKR
jgi:HEAT repeat protein